MVKNKIKLSNTFFFIFFQIFICIFNKTNQKSLNKIEYLSSLKLIDDKIVVVAKDGIHFYDKYFKIEMINKKIPFKKLIIDNNKNIVMAQFSENNDGYLLILISNNLYIFDKNEKKIISINFFNKINGSHFSLIPNKKNNNCIYFLITYINNESFIIVNCKYNLITKKINIKTKYLFFVNFERRGGGVKCNFMNPQLSLLKINYGILVCFYSNDKDIVSISFSLENNFKEIECLKYTTQIPIMHYSNLYINTITDKKKQKAFIYIICDGKLYWLTFDFINQFSDIHKENFVDNIYSKNKIFYFKETNEFISISPIFNCKKLIMVFNDNFYLKYKIIISFNNNKCYNYNYYSLIYENKYKMIFNGGYIKSFSDIKFNYNNKTRYLDENILGDIKCKTSSAESANYGLCTSCNELENYFEFSNNDLNSFVECYNTDTKPINTYFDSSDNKYKLCYETCHTCEKGGTPEENNCLTCDSNHIQKPGYPNSTNCVTECKYSYYYTPYGYYRCSNSSNCPNEASLYIRKLKKCTNDCNKEKIYIYQYGGECLEECPQYTSPDDKNICVDTVIGSCSKSESQIDLKTFLTGGGVDLNAKNYAKDFSYTSKHISIFFNNIYSIILYKDTNCIDELSINMAKIDFGICYKRMQQHIDTNEKLIIALVERTNGNQMKSTSYSFYSPKDGEKLDSETLCKGEEVVVKKNVISQLNNSDSTINIESALYLTKQSIDIFNLSNEFYTDICYHFDSPNGKDVPFQDRIHYYYPNLTLCELGCVSQGVNFETMESICQCKINDIMNNDFVSENAFVKDRLGEIAALLSSSNLLVLTCYKNVFQIDSIMEGTGGFIILGIIFCELLLTFIFYINDMGYIKKFLFNLAQYYVISVHKNKIKNIDKYINLFGNEKVKSVPPMRKNKKNYSSNNLKTSKSKIKDNIKKAKKKESQKNLKYNKQSTFDFDKNAQQKAKIKSALSKAKKRCGNLDIQEYLKPELDDMIYDDAIKYDERTFCEFFIEKLKEKQKIMDTFYHKEKIRPISIKIILLLLNINLYFVINGLFFNETYIIKLYNSNDDEENFFSYLYRSINNFIYTTLVGIIINIIINCIFIEERKIKRILLREKEDIMQLKNEISINVKSINKRYTIFIILCFFISLFSWYYISCFNVVYPGVKTEWIKSSITIIIIMQILSVLNILLESILRSLSFECKSEKIYKAKQFIS